MPMAEPAHPDREFPYSVQPEPVAPPIDPRLGPNLVRSDRELPPHSRLNSTAETIGSAVGSAVGKVRQIPDRLQEMKERFTVIRGRKQEDTVSKAKDVAEDLKRGAQQKMQEARTRADRLARENPLQTILAIAGLGLVLGIVLRIWRDHAD